MKYTKKDQSQRRRRRLTDDLTSKQLGASSPLVAASPITQSPMNDNATDVPDVDANSTTVPTNSPKYAPPTITPAEAGQSGSVDNPNDDSVSDVIDNLTPDDDEYKKQAISTENDDEIYHDLRPLCSPRDSFLSQLSCRAKTATYDHSFAFVFVILVLSTLCCCCFRRCKRRKDHRGEYRAVAAQYSGNTYDDAFHDNYSFGDGDDLDEFMDEDESWVNGDKRAIEMGSLSKEENGGLTLEEMNG